MKRFVKITAALLVASSLLIGCQSGSNKPADASKTAEAAAAQKTETATPKAEEKKPVELTLWHGYATDKAAKLDEYVKKYNEEHPDITIVPEFIAAGEEMLQKVQASVMTGKQPDLLWGFPTWTGVLESTGKLVEIEPLLDEAYKKEIPEGLWNVGKYNGKIYSVPVEAGTLLLIYNKDMFAEADIKEAPKTWEELYEVSKKLTTKDHKGIWMPIQPNERTTWTWLCFLGQNGGQLLTDDYKAAGFDKATGTEAMEYYTKFVTEGYAPLTVGQDPFVEKQTAMVIATQGAAGSYITKYSMNVGVAMLPGNKAQATGLGSNHYFIFNNGEEKTKASFDFIKWITTGDVQAQWSMAVGYLPVSESAKQSKSFKDFVTERPYMQTAADALTFGLARPSIEQYPQISTEIGTVIEEISYGKTKPADGIDRIINKINSLLK
jgi:ABC-type glycerol-3-phosphate transport system substrate-binding protein